MDHYFVDGAHFSLNGVSLSDWEIVFIKLLVVFHHNVPDTLTLCCLDTDPPFFEEKQPITTNFANNYFGFTILIFVKVYIHTWYEKQN